MKSSIDIFYKKIITFIYIFFFINTFLISCSYSAGNHMDNEKTIKNGFNIDNVNKISIEPIASIWKPYHKIYITNLEEIKFIINELNNIKKTGGIDTIVQYNVIFYQDNIELFMLGLNMNLYHPESSFLRQRNYSKDKKPNGVDDFFIDRLLFDFFKSKLHDEKGRE